MRTKTAPTLAHELAFYASGSRHIAGVDEAGRGAWAGPVVAAAVILPLHTQQIDALVACGVNDSKKLSARQRDVCRECIQQVALCFAIGEATHTEIDANGILNATRLAMARAIQGLLLPADALVIDAVKLPAVALPQDVFYFADSISLSVAAASILAKTARDAFMRHLDSQLPNYGFAAHKGYGTQRHQLALQQQGVSWAHRRSYAPIKHLLQNTIAAVKPIVDIANV
jgi:ribonuclease HII